MVAGLLNAAWIALEVEIHVSDVLGTALHWLWIALLVGGGLFFAFWALVILSLLLLSAVNFWVTLLSFGRFGVDDEDWMQMGCFTGPALAAICFALLHHFHILKLT